MPTKLFSELSSNICIMVVFWKLKLDARLVGWHFYCNTELVLCIWCVDEMPDNFDTREKMVSDGLSRLFYFIVCFSLVDYGVYYNIPQRKTFFANYTRMYIEYIQHSIFDICFIRRIDISSKAFLCVTPKIDRNTENEQHKQHACIFSWRQYIILFSPSSSRSQVVLFALHTILLCSTSMVYTYRICNTVKWVKTIFGALSLSIRDFHPIKLWRKNAEEPK